LLLIAIDRLVLTISSPVLESGSNAASSVQSSFASRSNNNINNIEASTSTIPQSPSLAKKRTSILRKALDMSLNSPPSSPKRKTIQIWEAAVKGDVKTIHSLLSQGISVNQRDPVTDHTPLLAAVADLENPNQAPNIAILELLINRGAEINAYDQKTKQTLLHHLCSRPNPPPAVLKFLLERGANPNAVSASRQTPLHYLAERSKVSPLEQMRLLLDFGAEVDAKGPVMWTALHLLSASEKPFLDAMMLLLTREIDVNARDSNQWTALHFVAHYNQDPGPALKILVDAGADVNALTKRHEGIIQVLLKSKSIDRMALDQATVAALGGSSSSSTGGGSVSGSLPPPAGSSGLGISGMGMGSFGGHNRKRSSASILSNSGTYSSLPRITTVSEVAPSSPSTEFVNASNGILSPEEEAKEESLKKLADLIRWLNVECGVNLDLSLEYEDPYPPIHPKNQHVMYRAIRLGMRSIVAVLLETSLAMSEEHVLDEALQVTEDMQCALNMSTQPPLGIDTSNGTARSSLESSVSSPRNNFNHRRNSSVSSNGSLVAPGGGGSSVGGTTGASSSIITPKSLAQAAASISRIQEIEALLKIWRFSEQRQQLLDSVKARLARSNRRRAGSKSRSGHGGSGGGGSSGSGTAIAIGGSGEDDAACGSPASSISSEREREVFGGRSFTL
jgi:ankyrin repeat protein